MSTIVLLGGNQRSTLAVTRSLGRRGLRLIIGDRSKRSLAGQSRYCSARFQYPDPFDAPEAFVDAVSAACQAQHATMLLPTTDIDTQVVLEHAARFPGVNLPFAPYATINQLADKYQLMQLASQLGVAIPKTWYIDDPATLDSLLPEITYPVIIKPAASVIKHEGRWLASRVQRADSEAELKSIITHSRYLTHHRFMLQQYIAGHGQGIFTLYDHGRPVTFFSHQRLREKPPAGGVSTFSRSVAVDPALQTIAEQILGQVDWHGVAMIEFRIADDGTPYLMEINTRFWGSLQLAIDAGIDFPWLLYLQATGQPLPAASDYRLDQKLRWLLGDLDHLYLVWRDRDHQYDLADKRRVLAQYMNFFTGTTRYETLRLNDPRPFLFELRNYFFTKN